MYHLQEIQAKRYLKVSPADPAARWPGLSRSTLPNFQRMCILLSDGTRPLDFLQVVPEVARAYCTDGQNRHEPKVHGLTKLDWEAQMLDGKPRAVGPKHMAHATRQGETNISHVPEAGRDQYFARPRGSRRLLGSSSLLRLVELKLLNVVWSICHEGNCKMVTAASRFELSCHSLRYVTIMYFEARSSNASVIGCNLFHGRISYRTK